MGRNKFVENYHFFMVSLLKFVSNSTVDTIFFNNVCYAGLQFFKMLLCFHIDSSISSYPVKYHSVILKANLPMTLPSSFITSTYQSPVHSGTMFL